MNPHVNGFLSASDSEDRLLDLLKITSSEQAVEEGCSVDAYQFSKWSGIVCTTHPTTTLFCRLREIMT